MDLTKEALEHLESNRSTQQVILQEAVGDTKIPLVAVPQGLELESLEKYMAAPVRFRGEFKTNTLAEFAKYARTHQAQRVFIDGEKMVATAHFDLGNNDAPGFNDHTATLYGLRAAAYDKIRKLSDMSQRTLRVFIEDYRDELHALDATGNEIPLAKALAAIAKIDINQKKGSSHSDTNLSAKKSAFEEIEAKSSDTIPWGFDFTCTPYVGLDERNIRLRLGVDLDHSAPTFKLLIQRLETLVEDIAEEFQQKIESQLPSITTYRGTFASRQP